MAETVWRITLFQTCYGQTLQNVTHWRHSGSGAPAIEQVGAHMETFATLIKAGQIFDVLYFKAIAVDVSSGPNGSFVERSLNLRGGRQAHNAAILNSAYVMQLTTGLSGRRNRGRFFVGPVEPGFVPLGVFNQECHTTWDAVLDTIGPQFIGPNHASEWTLVVKGDTTSSNEAPLVTQIALRTTPGSMRRRMVGVGS